MCAWLAVGREGPEGRGLLQIQVQGRRPQGCLAGHLHGLGPSAVPSGAGAGNDVETGTFAGVRATAGTFAGVGAAAGALQGGDTGPRGRAGPHQAGHAGGGHVSHALHEVLEGFSKLGWLGNLREAATVRHLEKRGLRWVQFRVALHHSIHGRRTVPNHQQRRAL